MTQPQPGHQVPDSAWPSPTGPATQPDAAPAAASAAHPAAPSGPPSGPAATDDQGLAVRGGELERVFDESDPDVQFLRALAPTDKGQARRAFSALLRAIQSERRA